MPTGDSGHRAPVPQLGGKPVPNSAVFLPRSAAPGVRVQGRAPIGSAVQFLGNTINVGANGAFVLAIPADARGRLPVRVVRPQGQTPITLQLEVRAP